MEKNYNFGYGFILNYLDIKFPLPQNIADDFYLKRPSSKQLKLINEILNENSPGLAQIINMQKKESCIKHCVYITIGNNLVNLEGLRRPSRFNLFKIDQFES